MSYFVINLTEDGEVYVDQHTKEELEEKLTNGWWAAQAIHDKMPARLSTVTGLIIIKGEIIMPRNVQVVQKVEVP